MFSLRESMRYDFSQIRPDNGRYKGVMKVGVREFFFSTLFSEVNMESKTDTILTIPKWYFQMRGIDTVFPKNDNDEHKNS